MGKKTWKLLCAPGDGIGPEVMQQALKILEKAADIHGIELEIEHALIGGAAIDDCGDPLPANTLSMAKVADAVILGAVGGPKWDSLARRPEHSLLELRKELDCFANLRPAIMFSQLKDASTLKSEVVADLDLIIMRELVGGLYYGQPRGRIQLPSGAYEAFNTMRYSEPEVRRIAISAFELARKRQKKLCSVDKANVLEVSRLWREVTIEVAKDYPDVELTHMYVDNAAMQLVRSPKQFDVVFTNNTFGDILSDIAGMLTGSLGMLPSASLNEHSKGIYEPVHGSAPDIAGKGIANPLAMILSIAMMCRYTFEHHDMVVSIENAVRSALAKGLRTADIARGNEQVITTHMMGDAVAKLLM